MSSPRAKPEHAATMQFWTAVLSGPGQTAGVVRVTPGASVYAVGA
jgi:hypothetical protein